MSKPLEVCVVGTGRLSTRRIYPYLAPAGMRLAGACARTLSHAQDKCDLYGGRAYDDVEKMIDVEKPDGVLVCVGPELHTHVAHLCIERGIPVYTEKPPALDAKAALGVARAAQDAAVFCMTGFKKRYASCYRKASEWMVSPSQVETFSFDYASGRYDITEDRYQFVRDFALHIVDLTAWLFGKATRVAAFRKGWESFAVSLQMEDGAVGTLSLSDHRSADTPTEECEITLSNGNSMTIHGSSRWRTSVAGTPSQWHEPPTFLSVGDSGRDTGMLTELEIFADAVRSGSASTEHIEASYRGMVLLDAIIEAAGEGTVVMPEYKRL